MSYFFGIMRHLLAAANKIHWVWCGAILLCMLLLAVLHHRWKDSPKRLILWRLLCLLPAAACLLHYRLYAFAVSDVYLWFLPLYLIGAFALIPMPLARRKAGYSISAVLTGLLSVCCAAVFCTVSPHRYSHFTESYTEAFHALVQEMDRAYVLREWKQADFAALEAKYLPMVQEAERTQNPAVYLDAVTRFCSEMHDAHISVGGGYDRTAYQSERDLLTHEYGLAAVQLDDGAVIAVCTVPEVQALGITDGTVITKWDGKPVLQAAQENVWDRGFPVAANAERLAAIYLSGTGGETVEVSFLDGTGAEKTVTLTDLGDMHTRNEALYALRQRPQTDTDAAREAYRAQNFSTKMLTDKCGYIKLQSMTYDGGLLSLAHIKSYLTGNYEPVTAMFREKLNGLKAQGMEYLVIDLRNNTGGFMEFGAALCSLLTDQNQYAEGAGVRRGGKYQRTADLYIHGTGEFADLQCVALTNYKCASAGDTAALMLSRLPNVTLAGITDPCGIAQGTGGLCVLPELITVEYPYALCLDETGVPLIDPGTDRISRDPVEVRIPLDYGAAMTIFRDRQDHELQWAVGFLERGESP